MRAVFEIHLCHHWSQFGLRPIQIWVPDTPRPGFAENCRRQSLLAAAADRDDAGLQAFMDLALTDMAADAP